MTLQSEIRMTIMKQQNTTFLTAFICILFSTSSLAGIDSFFDITYEISPTSRNDIPTLTATLSTGEDVPLSNKGTVKFFNESKGFDMRMTVTQELTNELLLISAKCSDERCVITDVETKAPPHRGHVTVLK